MTSRLRESYVGLEQKVEERTNALQLRTQELTRTVKELKALGEISQLVSSTLDIRDCAEHDRLPRSGSALGN